MVFLHERLSQVLWDNSVVPTAVLGVYEIEDVINHCKQWPLSCYFPGFLVVVQQPSSRLTLGSLSFESMPVMIQEAERCPVH